MRKAKQIIYIVLLLLVLSGFIQVLPVVFVLRSMLLLTSLLNILQAQKCYQRQNKQAAVMLVLAAALMTVYAFLLKA